MLISRARPKYRFSFRGSRAVTIQVCPLVSESSAGPIFVKQNRWTVRLSSQLTPGDHRRRRLRHRRQRRQRRPRHRRTFRVPRVSLERSERKAGQTRT